MKTRDRILGAALALFNEEGATALSAVDIANALGISPGHLYYHFKGKPQIVAALFDAYEAELALVLEGALADLARPEAGLPDLHVQIQILLEEAHDMRFLFREAGALATAYPDLAPRYRRVLAGQRGGVTVMLEALAQRGLLHAAPHALESLARDITLGLTFKLTQLDLEGDAGLPRERIARAAAEIMAQVHALV
jgi:AcrR family transcriptional regulator